MRKYFLIMTAVALLLIGFTNTSEAATKTGWVSSKGHWYFYTQSGSLYKGWLNSGNKWYYMDNSGVMKTGWVYSGNKWYFMDNSGAMKTGWVYSGNKWYYMDNSGAMKTGWVYTGNKWYYMDSSGVMKTGWVYTGNQSYFLDGNGVMKTGWLHQGDNWYYFASNGAMAHDTIIDGYTLDHYGVWVVDPMEVKFQETVNSILAGANEQKTTLAKVLYVRNSIIDRTKYGFGEHADDPYGPLVYGKAICEGYTMAINYLLLQLNIPSKVVWYDPGLYSSDSHGWNLVQVDGKWYHLDATWDDGNQYRYFLLPDNVIKQDTDHTHWDIFNFMGESRFWGCDGWAYKETQIPAATDNQFSYIRQMNDIASAITTDYENFYYINNNDNNSIWEMSLDGKTNKRLLDGNFDNLIYLNNSLYVLKITYLENSNTQIGVYQVSLDGKEMNELKVFNVTGDFTWNYYLSDQSIYLSLNGQINKIN